MFFPCDFSGHRFVVSANGQRVVHQGYVDQIDRSVLQAFKPAQAGEYGRQ